MKILKKILIYIALMIILLAVLPLIIVWGSDAKKESSDVVPVISVLNQQGKQEEISLEEYVVGVVSAEMPANFQLEALKAQAIAARTFIYRNSPSPLGEGGRHGAISVCSDFKHCQAYLDIEGRREKWQERTEKYEKKVRQAVQETQGQIITVDDKAVSTPYFAICGGHTADSSTVWKGEEKTWLKGVTCKWCKDAAKYQSQVVFTLKEAAERLKVSEQDLKKMKIEKKNPEGRIATVKAGDKQLSGTEIRSKLALNSANFSWKIKGDKIVFSVRGYGHGVGLCQYGAAGLAKQGYTAEKILAYYYQGVKIKKVY
ncbi:MAG: stage II sporulation protein D [Bacillota bacterium]|jgi:stage II sporulation protein D